jgi:hypothetical protein
MRYLVLNVKIMVRLPVVGLIYMKKYVLPPSCETIVAGRAMDPVVKGMTGLVEPVINLLKNMAY